MNNSRQVNIGNGYLKDAPNKKLIFQIGDGAVTTPKLKDKNVTLSKLGQDVLSEIQRMIDKAKADLQNQINGIVQHGVAVSTEFGDDPYISVSQKTLTEAFNKVWSKIEDIAGEPTFGIDMVLNPEYFIGDDGCDVHITANTVGLIGKFESIAIYVNGQLVEEAQDVDYFECDTHIEDTSVIQCKAKIMGIEYSSQKIIKHYDAFFLGCGSVATDIMDVAHTIPIENGMRGAYDVVCEDQQHIIVVVEDSLQEGFIRADMNGFEIPMTEGSVTVDGKLYKIYISENTYQAGTYNIDING